MHDLVIALINPNTNTRTTAVMAGIARDVVVKSTPTRNVTVTGYTADAGAGMILDMAALETASIAVAAIVDRLSKDEKRRPDAIIVSAFGDPGLDYALAGFPCRAYGIGTESMRAAARATRRFAVATTTPGLQPGIDAIADRLGLASQYCGTFLTQSDPLKLAAEPLTQEAELEAAVQTAVETGGAEAVVVGGGPLAVAARALSKRMSCLLIEPIPEAMRSALNDLLHAPNNLERY